MAKKGWVKSIRCKSNALEDVYHPKPKSKPSSTKPLLPPLSCSNSSQSLRDVLLFFPKHPLLPKKPEPQPQPKPRTRSKPKPKPTIASEPSASPHPFPTLTEIPVGHSSRRVVEIIFSSSWSHRVPPFAGEIEMLFRVHNPSRTVSRFEEYRAAVRSRASASDDARCAADGNEMMRFHCAAACGVAAAGAEVIFDAGVVPTVSSLSGGKVEGVRTFSGSGGAHESVGGGAGRRAMLVCRVIAGRVRSESEPEQPCLDAEFESVSVGKGELMVFDHRAVLPCFLIIYNCKVSNQVKN